MTDTRTPTERRGYPLPPWAQAESPAEHTGADVLEYLLGLLEAYPLTEDGVRQAEAFLDAWLDRHRDAQAHASRCTLEDHEGLAADVAALRGERDALLTELEEERDRHHPAPAGWHRVTVSLVVAPLEVLDPHGLGVVARKASEAAVRAVVRRFLREAGGAVEGPHVDAIVRTIVEADLDDRVAARVAELNRTARAAMLAGTRPAVPGEPLVKTATGPLTREHLEAAVELCAMAPYADA